MRGLSGVCVVGVLLAAAAVVGLVGAASAATRPSPRVALEVRLDGDGTVRINGHYRFTCSEPVGLSCAAVHHFRRGSRVVIRVRARTGWKLIKWDGACKGTSNECVLRPGTQKTTVTVRTVPPGDWRNPYPLGAPVDSGNWQVQVLGATLKANAVMESAGNPPPRAGTQYALVHLALTNEASNQQYLDLYAQELITKGVHKPPNPNGYLPGVGPMPSSDLDLTRIGLTDPGETVTGYLAYLIDSDDASTLEVNVFGQQPTWLALH